MGAYLAIYFPVFYFPVKEMRQHEENLGVVCDGSDGTDGFCGIELCAAR
jgi:hypothetical protein